MNLTRRSAGNVVLKGQLLDRLGPLQIVDHGRSVLECLDSADHLAGGVAQRGHTDLHGNPLAVLALGEHQQRAIAARSGDDGPVQGAVLLAAQLMAVLVDVAQDVVETRPADDFLRGPARDPLGRFAPVGDPAFQVADVDPVAERVDDGRDIDGGCRFHGKTPKS